MKVQIEIPKKAVNLAIAQISQSASNDDDLTALEHLSPSILVHLKL